MLSGATPILTNIPGRHLDPLLLAQSQPQDLIGYILVAYEASSSPTDSTQSRFYDLLLLRGSHIYECARLNSDLRFHIGLDIVLQHFKRPDIHNLARIFLFSIEDHLIQNFRSTFIYEPCLKIQVHGLSKKQMTSILTATNVQQGLIECNQFKEIPPSLDLRTISTPEDLALYRPPFKHGRILLYDVKKNQELIQTRPSSTASLIHPRTTDLSNSTNDEASPEHRLIIQRLDSPTPSSEESPLSAIDEREMENFTQQISRILNDTSTRPGENRISAGKHTLRPTLKRPRSPHRIAAPSASARVVSDVAIVFSDLLQAFRAHLEGICSSRFEQLYDHALRKARCSTPAFDPEQLTAESAPLVLEVIEQVCQDAPFMRRSRLRSAAQNLVADIYNKHYELLEKSGAIDRVEQFYYQLKK